MVPTPKTFPPSGQHYSEEEVGLPKLMGFNLLAIQFVGLKRGLYHGIPPFSDTPDRCVLISFVWSTPHLSHTAPIHAMKQQTAVGSGSLEYVIMKIV